VDAGSESHWPGWQYLVALPCIYPPWPVMVRCLHGRPAM